MTGQNYPSDVARSDMEESGQTSQLSMGQLVEQGCHPPDEAMQEDPITAAVHAVFVVCRHHSHLIPGEVLLLRSLHGGGS